MPIITFWSDIQKETGQTATAIALATQMAIEHNNRILLLGTYRNGNDIHSAFWGNEKDKKSLASLLGGNKKVSIESGIQGLMKMAASNKLSPEQITNYTKIIFKNRLEVLEEYQEASQGENDIEYKSVMAFYPDLIRRAALYYDYIIIDFQKGDSTYLEDILQLTDIIVYGLNQKLASVEEFMKNMQEGRLKQQESKIIPYIGRYDSFSKYNAKNVSRYMGKRKEISAIPYNTLFSDVLNEGGIADLFLKIKTITVPDKNSEFMDQIRKLSDSIIYRLEELQMKRMQL